MPDIASPEYHAYLHKLTQYVATASFILHVGWLQDSSANDLADADSGNIAVGIIVGKVNPDRIACGSVGNWAGKDPFGTFDKAKYQFTLGRPDDPAFAKDWDVAYQTLQRVQKKTSRSGNDQYFLLNGKNIKFSQNVFEKRETVWSFISPASSKSLADYLSLPACHCSVCL